MFANFHPPPPIFAGNKPPMARLPPHVDDSWLASVSLVQLPDGSVHYRDKQLASTIKQLRKRLEQDDPMDEYKVTQRYYSSSPLMRPPYLPGNCRELERWLALEGENSLCVYLHTMVCLDVRIPFTLTKC